MLSVLALVSVAVRVIWLFARQKLFPESAKPQEHVFFNTQLGYYATCLLVANAFVDVAGMIGLRWLLDKGITEGFSSLSFGCRSIFLILLFRFALYSSR